MTVNNAAGAAYTGTTNFGFGWEFRVFIIDEIFIFRIYNIIFQEKFPLCLPISLEKWASKATQIAITYNTIKLFNVRVKYYGKKILLIFVIRRRPGLDLNYGAKIVF